MSATITHATTIPATAPAVIPAIAPAPINDDKKHCVESPKHTPQKSNSAVMFVYWHTALPPVPVQLLAYKHGVAPSGQVMFWYTHPLAAKQKSLVHESKSSHTTVPVALHCGPPRPLPPTHVYRLHLDGPVHTTGVYTQPTMESQLSVVHQLLSSHTTVVESQFPVDALQLYVMHGVDAWQLTGEYTQPLWLSHESSVQLLLSLHTTVV